MALGRDNPHAHAAGRAGDIQPPRAGLAGAWTAGRGVLISNAALEAPTEFDRTRVEGDAPPGWEVELYRGGELLGVQGVTGDGRYVFDPVALGPGLNEFRVVLYGPAGQRREERRVVDVAARLLRPGHQEYRFALGQPGTRLLGFALPRHQPLHAGSPWAGSAEWAWGLSRHLSARVVASHTPVSNEPDAPFSNYAGLEFTAGLGPSTWQLEWMRQFDKGSDLPATPTARHREAWRAAGVVPLGPAGVSWRHSRVGTGVRSPVSADVSRAIRRDSAVWMGLPLGGGVSLGTTVQRRVFADERVEDQWGPFLRHPLGSLFFDHQFLVVRHRDRGITVLRDHAWVPTASYWGSAWSGRLSATVRLEPQHQIERLQASAQWRQSDGSVVSAAFSRLPDSGEHHLVMGASREWQRLVLTLSASVSNRGERRLGVGVATSFGFDGDGRLTLSVQRQASAGRADVRVWAPSDNAGDGSGRRRVPQVGLLVDGGRHRPAGGNDPQQLLLSGLPVTRAVRVQLDEGSLDDPFLMAQANEHVFVPRPGVLHPIEFTLVPALEVAGTVTDRQAQALPGLRVELLNADEQVVASQRTQYDGYYLFHRLPPGRYRIRIPADQRVRDVQTTKLRITQAAERAVPSGTPFEPQIDNVDLQVDLVPPR